MLYFYVLRSQRGFNFECFLFVFGYFSFCIYIHTGHHDCILTCSITFMRRKWLNCEIRTLCTIVFLFPYKGKYRPHLRRIDKLKSVDCSPDLPLTSPCYDYTFFCFLHVISRHLELPKMTYSYIWVTGEVTHFRWRQYNVSFFSFIRWFWLLGRRWDGWMLGGWLDS